MGKMIILQGTPCAGKTTWARSAVAGKKDWIVISKDDIRHSLGDYWVPEREKLVGRLEEQALTLALKMNYTVISDGVNYDDGRLRFLQQLADANDAPAEIKQLYVPFREAVRRDNNPDRTHHLGEEAIRGFYEKYFPDRLKEELSQPEPTAPAVQARIMTTEDGQTIWNPTAEDLANIKRMAALRYPPSSIAHALKVPYSEFSRHLAKKDGDVWEVYNDAKIEGEIKYRQTTQAAAERGEEWAIKIIEGWNREQLKEELGF